MPNEATKIHTDAEVQSALPKSIIRPWENLVHNKYKNGLGYDKDVSFIFQITQIPSNFTVMGFFMAVHLQLFQIMLLFCNNNNKMLNANTMTELAI